MGLFGSSPDPVPCTRTTTFRIPRDVGSVVMVVNIPTLSSTHGAEKASFQRSAIEGLGKANLTARSRGDRRTPWNPTTPTESLASRDPGTTLPR